MADRTTGFLRLLVFLGMILIFLVPTPSAKAMSPDMTGAPWGPFYLVPDPSVAQPVITYQTVTDFGAYHAADPFLFYENGTWYLFFEAATAVDSGRIALATSTDGLHWTYKQIVLTETFHLSDPQVFSDGGKYYMIPEASMSNSIRLYQASSFPYNWQYVATLASGRAFVDSQIFRYNNTWWMFVSDTSNRNCYLYFSDNLTSGWQEHPMSPIVSNDASKARGSGRAFLYNGGKIIRTAQKCDVTYGEKIRAFQVDVLTRTSYSEREIPESPLLEPGTGWNAVGMHHLDPWWTGATWRCAVDGIDGAGHWSIGIYKALDPATVVPPIPKTGWTLLYVDSQETTASNDRATNAFDGSSSTIWHTEGYLKSPPCPHEIQIDMGKTYNVSGFRYLPRQDGVSNGRIGQYEFYVSSDGLSWGSAVATGTFANDEVEKEVMFTTATGRYIRLRALTEVNGKPWTSAAELTALGYETASQLPHGTIDTPSGDQTINAGDRVNFTGTGNSPAGFVPLSYLWTFGPDSGIADSNAEDPGNVQFNRFGTHKVTFKTTDSHGGVDPSPPTRTITVRPGPLPKTSWTLVYVDSQETTAAHDVATNAFDGVSSTMWHTEGYLKSPPCPHEIQIDLGATCQVAGFRYLPRQDGLVNGRIGQYEFYVSADGQSWGTPAATGTFANTAAEKEITFPSIVSGRFIRLRALSEVNGKPWTSMAELTVLGQSASSQLPRGTIDTPTGDLTINVGDQVYFSGTGNSPAGALPLSFLWTFGDNSGIPAATVEDPGNVRFNTAGIFQVTFQVTDSQGRVDPGPPTRKITVRPPDISKNSWSVAYVDSQETTAAHDVATNAFDGSPATIWHTEGYLKSPPCPHEIQIDLGASYSISGFRYLPRQDGISNGRIGQYEFYVSADKQSWGNPVAAGTFANSAEEKEIFFSTANGRYVRLRALSEVNGQPWTSMAELAVMGTPQ